jgi:hypothetical protein
MFSLNEYTIFYKIFKSLAKNEKLTRKVILMKIRIKLSELINILIEKNQAPLLKKYNLNMDMVKDIQQALRQGKWRFVN